MFRFRHHSGYDAVRNAIDAAVATDNGRHGIGPVDALIDALEAQGLTLTYTDEVDA